MLFRSKYWPTGGIRLLAWEGTAPHESAIRLQIGAVEATIDRASVRLPLRRITADVRDATAGSHSTPLLPDSAIPAPAALIDALAIAAESPDGEHDALRDAVCNYTRAMRVAGHPPERVLVAVKTIASRSVTGPRVDEQAHLLDRIVKWCIAEYYRAE